MIHYGPRFAGGWGWAMSLSFLVFWLLVAAGIVVLALYLARSGRRPFQPYQGYGGLPTAPGQPGPPPSGGASTPEQILAERFARGEIEEDEFRRRMAALRAEAPHPGAAPPAT